MCIRDRFSAQLAAVLGLPFAFASHFAPDHLAAALELYRSEFRPSASLAESYAMAAVAVYADETDSKAARLFTSLQQSFVNLRRGTPAPLPPPVDNMDGRWSELEEAGVRHAFREAIVGSPETVKRGIHAVSYTHLNQGAPHVHNERSGAPWALREGRDGGLHA